jgi:4'-phosphopantetheinyl transferase
MCCAFGPRKHDALLPLRPGAVELWVAPIQPMPQVDRARLFDLVLSEEERQRHARFMFDKDRLRYLVTRALVRHVLSCYLPLHPADWQFAATSFGRPFVVNPHPDIPGLSFNLSHSEQVVVLGLTRGGQLGVDVEDLHRHLPVEIAESFFAADELRQLKALPPARPLDAERKLHQGTRQGAVAPAGQVRLRNGRPAADAILLRPGHR